MFYTFLDIDDDKQRKNILHNLLTSIPSSVNMEGDRYEGGDINGGELNVDNRSLGEGCQPDGVTVYGDRLDREIFPTVTRGRVPIPIKT